MESGEIPPEDLDSLSRNLAFHLKRLVDERDTQLEVMTYCICVCVNIHLFRLISKMTKYINNADQRTKKCRKFNELKFSLLLGEIC